jgi:hypothetical protein
MQNAQTSPFLDVIHEIEWFAVGGLYSWIFSITPEALAFLGYVHASFRVLA